MTSDRSPPPWRAPLGRIASGVAAARARVAPRLAPLRSARLRAHAADLAKGLRSLRPARPARELLREAPRSLRRAPTAIVRGWKASRLATERYRLLTDVLGALVIVGVVLTILAAVSGGTWPPVLVVESGSMMHSLGDTQYGRLGTIDPGDIILVRPTHGVVETWAQNGDKHYGRPGDVIVYAPNGNRANISVVHRAMAYVEVSRGANDQLSYHLHWIDGQIIDFGREGIYFPPLGFDEETGFTPANGYKPAYSGYITKGDNAFLNPVPDQAGGVSQLVDPSWIIGRASGEVPWIGLGKLALQSRTNPAVAGWSRVGNAFAPLELWTCFWVLLATVVLVPLTIDSWRWHKRLQVERAREEALLEENRRRREARAKQLEEERLRRVALPPPIVASARPPPPVRRKASFAPVTRPSAGAAARPATTASAPAAKKRATFLPVDRERPGDG